MASTKTIAKANGLKSTFLLDKDHLYMTSFGKGSQAQAEKDIADRRVTNLRNTFSASVTAANTLNIKGRAGTCQVAVPQVQDHLHARQTIEQYYFGKSFPDNIHIQLAYNIMDIQKILAAYTAMVVYTVNRMDRSAGDQDFLGMFKTQNTYEVSKSIFSAYDLNLIQGYSPRSGFQISRDVWNRHQRKELNTLRLAVDRYRAENSLSEKVSYLRSVSDYFLSLGLDDEKRFDQIVENWTKFQEFCKSAKDSAYYFGTAFSGPDGKFSEERTYDLLCLLGDFRQNTMHSSQMGASRLFWAEGKWKQDSALLSREILDSRIRQLNDHFCSQNKVNIRILKKIYPSLPAQQLVEEYYDFLIRKSFKNMGFSVKTLREAILGSQKEAKKLTEKEYDSVRSKLYSLIDFVIYRFYLEHPEDGQALVGKLRLSREEDSKNTVYLREADRLWSYLCKPLMEEIVPQMNGDNIKNLNKGKEETPEDLRSYLQNPQDLCVFAKAIYTFSLFLDGKEINMLLSGLINKFENIASFLETLQQLELDNQLTDDFCFFADSKKIAGDLRFIQSIARMNKGKKAKKNSEVTVKLCQYLDSAAVFGEYREDRVSQLYHLDIKERTSCKEDKSLRNFMINNVINNNRFSYVVRFLNPRDARKIMECPPLVAHILEKLPETQLQRYCGTVGLPYERPDTAVRDLTKLLLEVKFDNFLKVRQQVSAGSAEAIRKEKYKSIVSLYLTVLYLIVKTMVSINSRYMIAFSILERDLSIYRTKTGSKALVLDRSPHGITEIFGKEHWLNPRVQESIRNNQDAYSPNIFRIYRNKVDHLQAVTLLPEFIPYIHRVKSMFDIFHCVLIYSAAKDSSTKLAPPLENCKKYNTVCKDLLYGLNAPFAYNAARYINLSNREKFLESYGK